MIAWPLRQPRHPPRIRVAHWIGAVAIRALVVSGTAIQLALPLTVDEAVERIDGIGQDRGSLLAGFDLSWYAGS